MGLLENNKTRQETPLRKQQSAESLHNKLWTVETRFGIKIDCDLSFGSKKKIMTMDTMDT